MSQLFKTMLTSLNGTDRVKSSTNENQKTMTRKEDQVHKASNKSKHDDALPKGGHKRSLMGKVMGRFHYPGHWNQAKLAHSKGKSNNNLNNNKSHNNRARTPSSGCNADLHQEDLDFTSLNGDFDEKQLHDGEQEDDDDDDKENVALPEELCDLPSFKQTKNCDLGLIEETRRLLRERFAIQDPNNYYEHDYQRMLSDDWTVTRFLLRRRMDPKRTAKLMEECGLFRKTYKMSEVKLWEFPIEFHQVGGLFHYEPDKVGNITVYMRTRMYRRVPELSDVFKAFVLCVLEEADLANEGRGVAVIFDLTGCGLQNVDLSFLSWLLSSFRNYCPKGVSYIMVYNLPWFLNATAKLAMSWLSSSNRRALRFVHGKEIENFIEPAKLPDYLGGTCKRDYKAIPEGSKPAVEVCDRLDMSAEQALKIRDMFTQYLPDEVEHETQIKNTNNNHHSLDDESQVLSHHR